MYNISIEFNIMSSLASYDFDRYINNDELVAYLHHLSEAYPRLCSIESYGQSHEGRQLLLVTVTDNCTGPHECKPAHWIDANIHSVELTAGVAALYIIHYLLSNYEKDPNVTEALKKRTFYIVPRVNPDGVEAAIAPSPAFHRSSVRSWPFRDGFKDPGLHCEDVDGDGKCRTMRLKDDDGGWIENPKDSRCMVPVGPLGAAAGIQRYRLLEEGFIHGNFNGFTIEKPKDPSGLDLNRNFPVGWSTEVKGSGDHPLSEPEVDHLVRAIRKRPNICGYNAFHTNGGMLLRPSSTKPDDSFPSKDLWVYKEFGKIGSELTGYPNYSCYEDLTWDKTECMSGAADDWIFEQLGVFGWTTEFWDPILQSTGKVAPKDLWYVSTTAEMELELCRWSDKHSPGAFAPWKPFQHPQLGEIEIGGADHLNIWWNPPLHKIKEEVAPHAKFAIYQALAAPCLEMKVFDAKCVAKGSNIWTIQVGIANTGWLPTNISEWAKKHNCVGGVLLELKSTNDSISSSGGSVSAGGVSVFSVVNGSPARILLGQLEGRGIINRISGDSKNDGTPDRLMHQWVISCPPGTQISASASHERAGTVTRTIVLTE